MGAERGRPWRGVYGERRGKLGGAWRRRRLGGANELYGTAEGGLWRAGDDGVRAVPARQDVNHGDGYGAAASLCGCLTGFGCGVGRACTRAKRGEDEGVLASGVLRRPGLCQGVVTACAGTSWACLGVFVLSKAGLDSIQGGYRRDQGGT